MPISIALVGNPNSGKTTLFNYLTGATQYVGNWPGVTVEKKEGWAKGTQRHVRIIDLPGVYSLSPSSQEEIITREYILTEKPDVVISIVDGTNLERNLYLTLQVMELGCPVIVAVNMMDSVRAKGDDIDCEKLSRFLGVEAVPITARNGEGVAHMMQHVQVLAKKPVKMDTHGVYDELTERMEDKVYALIQPHAMTAKLPERWAALRLMEGDQVVRSKLMLHEDDSTKLDKLLDEFVKSSRLKDIDMILADQRYRFITRIVAPCVKRGEGAHKATASERIDKVLTNRILALPIFFGLMAIMFMTTFGELGSMIADGAAVIIDGTIGIISNLIKSAGAPDWFHGMVIDGALSGVGAVLGFLPQIIMLFFFLSLLEDTGYMARVAFIMDRALRRLGLSGKSFIPMLMGFGCTTPAVMAARTMDNDKNRFMTILLTPFMSCGAKLPVYALFAGAFFVSNQSMVVFSLYMLGMLVAILAGIIMSNTIFKGEQAPFVMEMPPYRWPTVRGTLTHLWDRAKGFVVKAGSIILAMSVVIWFLQSYNISFQMVESNADSILGSIGKWIAPFFAPLGFGDWRASVALLTGLIAKEAVVSTSELLYGISDSAQATSVLSQYFTPLSAYTFMTFTLLYVPCIAAFATIKREMASWKWALGAAAMEISTAYVVSLLIYQVGRLFGF